jgi:hypothetical protein
MRCFALALLGCLASAAVPADLVTTLPGFDGKLPSKHYSGYIPTGEATGTKGQLHYWVIESENDPTTDPVVLWYNGGPGSSSLIGLLTENGQIAVNDNSLNGTGTPKVFYVSELRRSFNSFDLMCIFSLFSFEIVRQNKYSWSQKATMVYLEQPKGVGFSYCEGSNNAPGSCVNTDESTAIDGHEFLINFFKAYPEYSTLDFFITGESYAGTYIPMLMDQIDQKGDVPNFKGAMIGNGCWGSDCFYGMTENEIDYHVFSGHAMIPFELEEQITSTCTDFEKPTLACSKLLRESQDLAGRFNVYNIYDVCNGDDSLNTTMQNTTLRDIRDVQMDKNGEGVTLTKPSDAYSPHPALKGALNDFTCGGQGAMSKWLADPAVVAALHVKSDTGRMRYKQTAGDITALYKKLLPKYRVVIFSGDVDACVPYWGSEKFTRSIGGNATKAWHAWTSNSVDDRGEVVAGYAVGYKDFQFVTVKGKYGSIYLQLLITRL